MSVLTWSWQSFPPHPQTPRVRQRMREWLVCPRGRRHNHGACRQAEGPKDETLMRNDDTLGGGLGDKDNRKLQKL